MKPSLMTPHTIPFLVLAAGLLVLAVAMLTSWWREGSRR